jgi:hypothetical protein
MIPPSYRALLFDTFLPISAMEYERGNRVRAGRKGKAPEIKQSNGLLAVSTRRKKVLVAKNRHLGSAFDYRDRQLPLYPPH